jgi:hypothetical protein
MLINREILSAALAQGLPVSHVAERCTGRTTALALEFIAGAIRDPGEWITPCDHHQTEQADLHLFRLCRRMVLALKLDKFEFKDGKFRSMFAEQV